ncbi:MAG TPA: hypothetical protein VJL29_14135 [Thermoguttaceae bacterium]|nr:hypothetical protein [Thermoguttaceae bacterium]
MFLLERNALVTISPNYDREFEPGARFRWEMHVSLPFPFPSRRCVHQNVLVSGVEYEFEIHNHLDRLFVTPKNGPPIPRVILHDRTKPIPIEPQDHHLQREFLQSVVIFQESQEYASPNTAFAEAAKKIQGCFDHLSAFLAQQQMESPYLTAWLVYPISLFDVGTIYHSVHCFCNNHDTWHVWATAPAISLARRLQHPLFFLDTEDSTKNTLTSHPLIEAANELLAEAQMSLFRGLPRLTILNSYGAAESLANAVFKKIKTEFLMANNVPIEIATDLVEDERQRHKTEPSFLFHRGLRDLCGRSLQDENKEKYDALLELQKTRHRVAHTGYKPDLTEARVGHTLACECVQWLAGVGGLPVKPLLPPEEAQVHGFSTTAADINAINAGEFEFLRWALGFADASGSKPNVPDLGESG